MEKKVIGYFEDSNQAEQAANELKTKGFNEISIQENDNGGKEDLSNGPMRGRIIGGITGLEVSAGALIDYGFGYGIPEEHSDYDETKAREGNTVMVLKTDKAKTDEAATIMRNQGAKDVRVH